MRDECLIKIKSECLEGKKVTLVTENYENVVIYSNPQTDKPEELEIGFRLSYKDTETGNAIIRNDFGGYFYYRRSPHTGRVIFEIYWNDGSYEVGISENKEVNCGVVDTLAKGIKPQIDRAILERRTVHKLGVKLIPEAKILLDELEAEYESEYGSGNAV